MISNCDETARPKARTRSWCSTRRRSTVSRAARSATPGTLTGEDFVFSVTDTQKDGSLFLHRRPAAEGRRSTPATTASRRSNEDRRDAIRRAHSATHLLHWALQKTLGSARSAAGLEGRRGLAAVRLHQPLGGGAEQARHDRGDVEACVAAAQPIRVKAETLPLADARSRGR